MHSVGKFNKEISKFLNKGLTKRKKYRVSLVAQPTIYILNSVKKYMQQKSSSTPYPSSISSYFSLLY